MAIRLNSGEEDEILAQINVIPLVDVSLVLLIIFIATVNYILAPSIRIKLPKSSQAHTASDSESIHISLSSEGITYLDSELVTSKELKQKIEKMYKENPQKGVVLDIDKSVYFQRVVDILDVLNELNLSKLDIRTIEH